MRLLPLPMLVALMTSLLPARSLPWPKMTLLDETLVVPGQRIGTLKGTPGTGVYEANGSLYASLVGKVSTDAATGQITVTPYPQNAHRSVVPQLDQTILGKVTDVPLQSIASNMAFR